MLSTDLKKAIRKWQEERLGLSLEDALSDSVPVVARPARGNDASAGDDAGLTAVRLNGRSILVARADWVEPLKTITGDIHPDLLFTPFGAYELSRVTLPYEISVWGPNWFLFADAGSWRGRADNSVSVLTSDKLSGVDFDLFWHSYGPGSVAAFGVYQGDDLVALATVKDQGHPFMEIGVDVSRDAQASGLGSAVVSAAGTWILEQGRLPLATVAPFNVPSTRTLRRVGLGYGMTEMTGVKGPFRVPPQPIGKPLPDADIYDYYPDWAMNRDIRPRPEL
jgi:RimJ/RimL family protein N-acetyltransferase